MFPSLLVDSREYIAAASNLLSLGTWDACNSDETCQVLLSETRRTPGYPMIIAILHFHNLIYLFQFLIALFIPVLMSRLMAVTGFGIRQEKLTDLILLFCPLQFFYSSMLMPDILVQFLLLFLVLSWHRNHLFYTALSLSALVLLKPLFQPLVWLAIPLIIFRKEGRFFLLIPAMLVLLISGFNKIQTGAFHYTSMGAVNAWEYNIKGLSELDSSNYMEAGLNKMKSMNYEQKLAFLNHSVKTAILNNPVKYSLIHVKGVLASLIDPGRYDLIAFFKLKQSPGFLGAGFDKWHRILHNQSGLILGYFAFFLLINLIRLGYCFRAMITLPKQVLLPLILPVIYITLLTGPVGSARYLLPVIPFMAILAASGMEKSLIFRLIK